MLTCDSAAPMRLSIAHDGIASMRYGDDVVNRGVKKGAQVKAFAPVDDG